MTFTIHVKTTNPNNGGQGWSRNAAFAKARARKAQREAAHVLTRAHVGRDPTFPVTVTVTRVAPSAGLDPHDGLGAALKGCIDGIADGLGLKNDRDARVTWVLGQRRGAAGAYSVEVTVEAAPLAVAAPTLTQVASSAPERPLRSLRSRKPVLEEIE